ncbi:glycosyltransferase family 2 protein [[Erwinia] mediterraneensis]|uniref:glycosyltransferase family 2 protein n=1 Tax=[Erwinia] mediterraneensis TaxID=2161819 RepID=UPI0010320121|nr:glycosyltransferase [[Erwinia] mediterraneensis]
MPEKLLSVIIPTYNVENYIVECVDSLLKQIPSPSEIIIVNDGSTDGTLQLAEQHYGHLSQVKIITIPNGGLGNARDTGIALAEGEYLFFCDPDDIVVEGLFDELQSVVKNYPQVDLFCFNSCTFLDGDSQRTHPKVQHTRFGLQIPQQVFLSLLHNGRYTSAVWNYVLKKSVIEQHQLRFVKRLHEDHHFSLAAFVKCHQAWVSKQVYYKQRIRHGSLTNSQKGDDFFYQRYDAFMHAYHVLLTSVEKGPWRRELQKYYLLHSFRLMIYLSLYNRTPVPEYVLNAIRVLGRDVKTRNYKEWLLLHMPELFIRLQNVKALKEMNKAV